MTTRNPGAHKQVDLPVDDKERRFKQFAKRASQWDLEQDYEQRPRKKRTQDKLTSRLPIKTADGQLRPSLLQEVPEAAADSAIEFSEGEKIGDASSEAVQEDVAPPVPLKQQVLEGKEELAKIASLINEDPEANSSYFKVLSQFARGGHVSLKILAIGTQLAVYKDVIPGYRIQPIAEEDAPVKVSKEVRQHRNYEQALVGGYQTYVRELAQLSKARKWNSLDEEKSLADVAISCACALILAVSHFNFRGELLKMIVQRLASGIKDPIHQKCCETLEDLFRLDEDGKPSLEAVTLLAQMMKSRNYRVDESVLNTFLHLRLLSEYSFKGSHQHVDHGLSRQGIRVARRKEKQRFQTKKQRRLEKDQKTVEKEMREADAAVGHEERERLQGETLKLVFITYFRILKLRPANLMGGTLEGLAKYAHLINQDFFGDLLEVLKELIEKKAAVDEDTDDSVVGDYCPEKIEARVRETLLCITTAFTLLQGQETRSAVQSLRLDLNFFVRQLYRMLFQLIMDPDVERNAQSFHLPDPSHKAGSSSTTTTWTRKNKINVQASIVLLLRCLSSVIAPTDRARSVPPLRIATFSKQILTSSLQLPEKSCLAVLGLMNGVTKIHGKKLAGLWCTEEKRGDGVFDPSLSLDPDASNPFATTVWEGELLRHHFSPKVRELLQRMEGNIAQA